MTKEKHEEELIRGLISIIAPPHTDITVKNKAKKALVHAIELTDKNKFSMLDLKVIIIEELQGYGVIENGTQSLKDYMAKEFPFVLESLTLKKK